ncbi:bifunctional nuclease 2-like isoform X2 [Hibiscus syriacus]|uniref:bifunctional nuclease 2-like isoform X2 n=1 Tax=Hibiscus syriacus TaxID=106335 RepID=UPI001920C077|nr:bifunctional nuclease 2-like isoform X2 [Hibiscus syriacus]
MTVVYLLQDCPDQFNLVKHVVERLEYKVKMVRITERVVNTYFAKLYFTKPGENDAISVDARPSDAINVANRCKAPIYVSKRILLEDAIRIGYGMGRVCDRKSTYDVLLDRVVYVQCCRWPGFANGGVESGEEYRFSCRRRKVQ